MTTGWKGLAGAGFLAAGLALLTGCGSTDPQEGTGGPSTVLGSRTAALTVLVRGAGFCTHLPATPSPACDPRPLPGVTVVVRDAAGASVTSGRTDEGGRVVLAVPPGAHVVMSDPVPGFSEAARPASVETRPGEPVEIVLTHNTGFQ